MSKKSPGEKAIEAAGGPSEIARHFKLSPWAVSKWRHRVPAERVLELERLSGVSRHELRPDLYPENEVA